jgi:hypothetical protein
MLLAGCLTLAGTRSYNMKFPEVSFCYWQFCFMIGHSSLWSWFHGIIVSSSRTSWLHQMHITSCNTLRPQHSKIIGFWPPVLGAHSLESVPALECYPTHKKCPLLDLVIYECLSSCLSSPCDLLWVKPIGDNITRMLSQTQLPLPRHSIIHRVLPTFDVKNMILTYVKDFSWKNGPNLPDFKAKKIRKHQKYMISSSR